MSPPARRQPVRRFPSGAVLAAALIFAACTPAPPDPHNPYPGRTVSRPAPTTQVKAEPAPEPAPAESEAKPQIREARAVAPPPEPEPGPESLPEPDELAGLDAGAIRDRLGEPVFIRTDPPAALWQYRRDGCVLDLYLFETGARLSVRHFEFRSDPRQDHEATAKAGAPLDAGKCYAALIRAQDARAGRQNRIRQ